MLGATRTGRPGVLRSMGSQSRTWSSDWAELNCTRWRKSQGKRQTWKSISKSVKQASDKIQGLIYKRHQQNYTFKSITWKKDSLKRLILGHVLRGSLRPHGLLPSRLLRPWDFPAKNTGMGCRFLLQRIFNPDSGIEPKSLRSPAWAGGFFTTNVNIYIYLIYVWK